MLKIRIALAGDAFEFEGNATLNEVAPFITGFYTARTESSPAIDALAKKLDEQSDRLSQAVSANQPT